MSADGLEFLYRVSGIVSSDLQLEDMLDAMIRLAGEVTGCDACLVYLPEPDGSEVVLRASQLPHNAEIGCLRFRMGEGVTGWVAEHASVVALDRDASADPRFKTINTLIEDTYEALLSVPLIAAGKVIGVINVHHKDAHAHTPAEVAMLCFVGEQMGTAIAASRMRETALEMERELESRKLIERAKGILQRNDGLTEEEAYLRLRNESRRSRRPLRELAEAIILADKIRSQKAEARSQSETGSQKTGIGFSETES